MFEHRRWSLMAMLSELGTSIRATFGRTGQFLAGVIVGLVLGSAIGVLAAQMVGGNGYLNGWEVTREGETICSDPYVYVSSREIDCED
jgi:hypothetical protein